MGYRQVGEYLDGRGGYPEMVERSIAATRQLARRQLTWLRAEACALRVDCHGADLPGMVLSSLEGGCSDGKKGGLDTV